MSVKKRILSVLLALALMFGTVPMTVFAELTGPCADDVTVTLKVTNETAQKEGRTITKTGDILKLEIYLQGTGENQGLQAATISISYDQKLATVESGDFSETLNSRKDIFNLDSNYRTPGELHTLLTADANNRLMYGCADADFPQDYKPVYLPVGQGLLYYSATLRVSDLANTGLNGPMTFSLSVDDIVIGHCMGLDKDCAQGNPSKSATVEQKVEGDIITVDSTSPTFTDIDHDPKLDDHTYD